MLLACSNCKLCIFLSNCLWHLSLFLATSENIIFRCIGLEPLTTSLQLERIFLKRANNSAKYQDFAVSVTDESVAMGQCWNYSGRWIPKCPWDRSLPVPLHTLQIPHGLARDWTWASDMRGRWLAAFVLAFPSRRQVIFVIIMKVCVLMLFL
jgi:hypothetical protein